MFLCMYCFKENHISLVEFFFGYVMAVCVLCLFPGGDTLICSHICRYGPFFGCNIFNHNIWGGGQKSEYIWGHDIIVDI